MANKSKRLTGAQHDALRRLYLEGSKEFFIETTARCGYSLERRGLIIIDDSTARLTPEGEAVLHAEFYADEVRWLRELTDGKADRIDINGCWVSRSVHGNIVTWHVEGWKQTRSFTRRADVLDFVFDRGKFKRRGQ